MTPHVLSQRTDLELVLSTHGTETLLKYLSRSCISLVSLKLTMNGSKLLKSDFDGFFHNNPTLCTLHLLTQNHFINNAFLSDIAAHCPKLHEFWLLENKNVTLVGISNFITSCTNLAKMEITKATSSVLLFEYVHNTAKNNKSVLFLDEFQHDSGIYQAKNIINFFTIINNFNTVTLCYIHGMCDKMMKTIAEFNPNMLSFSVHSQKSSGTSYTIAGFRNFIKKCTHLSHLCLYRTRSHFHIVQIAELIECVMNSHLKMLEFDDRFKFDFIRHTLATSEYKKRDTPFTLITGDHLNKKDLEQLNTIFKSREMNVKVRDLAIMNEWQRKVLYRKDE